MDWYEAGVLVVVFSVSVVLLYFLGLLPMTVLLAIVLIDKVVLCQAKIQGHLGIELQTIPTLLSAIIYGPVVGFFFGFLVLTLMDFFTLVFAPPFEVEWIPGMPSYNSTVYGVIAIIAWALYPSLGLIEIVVICTIIKSLAFMLKDLVVKGMPNVVAGVINTLLNFVLMRGLIQVGFLSFLGL